jgi:septal ring factor EnvC (AmiA/AmiB activator)
MNTSFPGLSQPSNCQHASHKWEKKTFQLLFNRELERSEWDQERTRLQKENDKLQKQVEDMKHALVQLDQDVGRFQASFLLMHGSINQGYDQLQSKCLSLEESIYYFFNDRNLQDQRT